ncbi:hypothetical protein APU01nite_00320 [Alkalibacterium putridalgicola]|uniref:Uncharacterized protein n=1 Tax=Alkalibacterium putridalgicola TaxID=426703 RepID=A0ABQ0UV97_9LACT|nr:hypothetical protein APU01nite_00320 [Alkalibacterium putridalgicola]
MLGVLGDMYFVGTIRTLHDLSDLVRCFFPVSGKFVHDKNQMFILHVITNSCFITIVYVKYIEKKDNLSKYTETELVLVIVTLKVLECFELTNSDLKGGY